MAIDTIIFDLDGTLIEPEHDFVISECKRLFPQIIGLDITEFELENALTRASHFKIKC